PISIRSLKEKRLIPLDYTITDVIIAGNDAYCGSHNKVTGVDFKGQANTWWSHEIEGTVRGLVASDECLIASTDQGVICCFADAELPETVNQKPQTPQATNPLYQQAAKAICDKTDVSTGICVDLGAENADLALELARQSDFQIYVVMADPDKAQQARERLAQAGLYGSRVAVHLADPEHLPYSKNFANLV
ncbi:MAG: hypothetical protein KDA74_01325, partial [Planctomycetaceae bacterium]|nr:hypothetical protein [Planctomycetaceae bacterium]